MANKLAKGLQMGNTPNTNIPGPKLPGLPPGYKCASPTLKQIPHPFKANAKKA